MRVITEESTAAEIKAELDKRSVDRLEVSLSSKGVTVRAILHAMRGPEGPVCSPYFTNASMAVAFDALLSHIDGMVQSGVAVRDANGNLRGLYPHNDAGRRYAEKHMRSIGRGASVSS